MKLVVIEGIGKKETVEKYLGSGYKVFATKGHVRDLPSRTLAVDIKNNFEPKYDIMPDKKDIVKSLIAESQKAEQVLLATDPDREGEAISWHVANILGIPADSKARIQFNEISKTAIQEALKHPRAIDANLVDAQQARRVMDRLVGYKISPVLCKKIQSKLSAGRVQSVTLRLIVEREREIRSFVPEEYWPFFSVLKKSGIKFRATLDKFNGKKIKLKTKDDVDKIIEYLSGKSYVVANVKKSVTKTHPLPPFITSTMQQDALNKLGMTLSQTTAAAQNLYEGVDIPGEGKVALITYIRTDSTRVATAAQNAARDFIAEKYGKEYVPAKPNNYAAKKSAQDAHEAIRPITLERTPASVEQYLSRNNYRLYKLIYERFIASQMSEAKYNSLAVEIQADDCRFKVTGRTPLFDGYTVIYSKFEDNKEGEDEVVAKLPDLKEGDLLDFVEYKFEQKFTKPPARYTEASLVKAMEEKGIGRPATYTPTVSLLFKREYVAKESKFIIPTELGEKVTDMLVKYFPDIMNVKFTAEMESKLDDIAENGQIWQNVVAKFYDGLEDKIRISLDDSFSLRQADEKSDIVCSKCGAIMVYKHGKFGKFLACPNYPKCKNTIALDESGQTIEAPKVQESDLKCEFCGKTMVIKQGKYGPFLACPGYPKCKNIKSLQESDNKQESFGICPTCGKPLKKLNGKSVFYGCTGYPDCKFTSNSPVVDGKCPECGAYLVEKNYKTGKYHCCSDRACGYKIKLEDK